METIYLSRNVLYEFGAAKIWLGLVFLESYSFTVVLGVYQLCASALCLSSISSLQ